MKVCYNANIGLTGLIVNRKAKNLNSKARATESKLQPGARCRPSQRARSRL